jgi:hypothetical protein
MEKVSLLTFMKNFSVTILCVNVSYYDNIFIAL